MRHREVQYRGLWDIVRFDIVQLLDLVVMCMAN